METLNNNITDLFPQDELLALRELGIPPQELIFIKKPLFNLSMFEEKQYICHLQLKDGLYSFELPPKLPRRFKKRIRQTERKLLCGNNSQMKKLMDSARKNAEFIERFNNELFFKHSFYKGNRLNVDELFRLYGTAPHNQIIDLSADSDRPPFIALYAMTFYACTPEDIFTVDGIFSMQPERHADNAKKTSGNRVFNLVIRGEREEIVQVLRQMGKALEEIRPLRVNLSDAAMLARNYTLFHALSEMGRVFAKCAVRADAGVPSSSMVAARTLMKYAPLVELCDLISTLNHHEDYRDSLAYKKCKDFF
ncbi:MAG: hypothetical protein FWG83_04455 [Oscillospiraceae bacterium]|nr:hypothetical protein [Oscillospiraceae bacterium]